MSFDNLEYPESIDRRLNWPLGTAARMARRRQLPFYRLPDGAIRLRWEEVAPLVEHVMPEKREMAMV
jgi:hypothetical protein